MAKKTATTAGSKARSEAQSGKRLTITLVRSVIGFNRTQAATVQGMGLRRINSSVELADTPATRGMIHKVRHLVTVSE